MRINLLPERYKPQPRAKLLNVILLLVPAVLMAVAVIFASFEYTTNQNLQKETANYDKMILSYQGELALVKERDLLIAQVEQIHQEVTKINELYPDNYRIFCDITNSISEDIWLDRVDLSKGNAITVGGKSIYFPEIGNFLDKANELFPKAKLQSVTKEKTDKNAVYYSFILDLDTGRSPVEYGQN